MGQHASSEARKGARGLTVHCWQPGYLDKPAETLGFASPPRGRFAVCSITSADRSPQRSSAIILCYVQRKAQDRPVQCAIGVICAGRRSYIPVLARPVSGLIIALEKPRAAPKGLEYAAIAEQGRTNRKNDDRRTPDRPGASLRPVGLASTFALCRPLTVGGGNRVADTPETMGQTVRRTAHRRPTRVELTT
jgi:hypothetical protein